MNVVVEIVQVWAIGAVLVGWWLLLTDAWRDRRDTRARRDHE